MVHIACLPGDGRDWKSGTAIGITQEDNTRSEELEEQTQVYRDHRQRNGHAHHPRQPIHGTQYCRTTSTVGPAGTTVSENATESGTADPGQGDLGSVGDPVERLLFDVPASRQGENWAAESRRLQEMSEIPGVRSAHVRRGPD